MRTAVTVSALSLAIVGAVLLFAPDEAGGMLMLDSGDPVIMQVLGAALLGYGIANWTARGTLLGGIYGRAVVAGNQMHLMIGALLLVKHGAQVGAPQPAYWVLTALYVFGAAFFSYLMFFNTGIPKR